MVQRLFLYSEHHRLALGRSYVIDVLTHRHDRQGRRMCGSRGYECSNMGNIAKNWIVGLSDEVFSVIVENATPDLELEA